MDKSCSVSGFKSRLCEDCGLAPCVLITVICRIEWNCSPKFRSEQELYSVPLLRVVWKLLFSIPLRLLSSHVLSIEVAASIAHRIMYSLLMDFLDPDDFTYPALKARTSQTSTSGISSLSGKRLTLKFQWRMSANLEFLVKAKLQKYRSRNKLHILIITWDQSRTSSDLSPLLLDSKRDMDGELLKRDSFHSGSEQSLRSGSFHSPTELEEKRLKICILF